MINGFKHTEYLYAKTHNYIMARSSLDAYNLARSKYGTHSMGVDARKRLSEKQSLNNSGGKSKWFDINGIKVQGTWERDIAIKFNELNIEWIKPKTNNSIWIYEKDGKQHSYSPDFYLPEFDIYIEIKGYWWGDDKNKMDIIIKTYPERRLLIIEKEEYLECLAI